MRYLLAILALTACSEKVQHLGGCNDDYLVEPTQASSPKPGLFTTSFPQVGCLNAPDGHDESTYRVVFSVYIPTIKAGSLLYVSGQMKLTNDTPKPMLAGSYIVISDGPHNVYGTYVGYKNGFNITPWMHHGVVVNYGSIVVPDQLDGVYVNFVGIAASGEKFLTGEFITVEQNEVAGRREGGLEVLIFD